MTMMKADMYSAFGEPSKVVSAVSTQAPTPGAGEALIKMKVSPIHNHDLITIRGGYGVKPKLPAIGGSEATGVVAALGPGVADLKVGARVAVSGTQSAWAEYLVVPASAAVPVPDAMADDVAAQILGMPMGSLLALNEFGAKPGDWVLVNAGNGAVGKVIAAAGRSRGVKVALIVRREEARVYLEKLGFGNVFVSDRADWKDRLAAAIGAARVAGAVDMIGGEATGDLAHFISNDGLLLSFGAMSNEPARIDVADLIFKQITVRGFWSHMLFAKLTPHQTQAMIAELFALAGSGDLRLPVEKVFPIEQGAQAMAAAEKSRDGKILIAA